MRRLSFCLLFILCFLYPLPTDCTSSEASSNPRPLRSAPVSSSSSKKWRKAANSIGDDAAHLPPEPAGSEPVVPYIKTVPIDFVREEQYPVDRLKENVPEYIKYIESKKYPSGRSALSQQIIRRLARSNFMQDSASSLKKWLELKGTSIWDAVRIIESPNFDAGQYNHLNELPRFYLKQRMLVSFEAFLKRFQYQDESESLFDRDDVDGSAKTTPLTNLIFLFLEPAYLNDSSVDPFFKVLVQTQSKALESCEWIFFDAWIRSGTPAWRYLKLYFDHCASPTKSVSLIFLLTAPNYCGPVTFQLMKFIVSIDSFDPNVRVPFADNGTDGKDPDNLPERTPFLHVCVLDSKYSTTFLPPLLTCKSIDTSVPTGKVVLSFKACEIVYVNEPIVYLAGALFNGWALFHLATHDRISSSLRLRDLFTFLFLHFIKLIWLTFYNLIIRDWPHYFRKSS